MHPKLFGIIGFQGCGKDTVADFLVKDYNYTKDAYARALKDICSILFSWPREMVEGGTKESREWREIKDDFWSDKLGRDVTPRKIIQEIGTNVFREHFDNNIWVYAIENRIRQTDKLIITDCRFPNEMDLIKRLGGVLLRVKRGPDPDWVGVATLANAGDEAAKYALKQLGVHQSEYAWIGYPVDYTVDNRVDLMYLREQINILMDVLNANP